MDKMNEGSDASAFVKTDVKFWITREKEREEGFTYVGAFLREIMRGIRRGTNEERSLWPEYKRGEIKERKARRVKTRVKITGLNYVNTSLQ